MAVTVSARERLKRFLYTSTELPKYVVGNPEKYKYYEPERLTVVNEILNSDHPEVFFNVIEIVNSENILPRRETLFVVLAYAASRCTALNSALRSRIYDTLMTVCRCDEDLFLFIKFCSKNRKSFSSSFNKHLKEYYNKKDPMVLAKDVASVNGYHGWKHKDILKLCHCKSKSFLTTIVFSYVLFGLKRAKVLAENNPEASDIIHYLSRMEELKRSENETAIIKLISQLHASYWQVPTFFRKSKLVWEALLPQMSINELLDALPRLYKLGFLKANTPFQTKVVETLTNPEKVKESKIYPCEVYIGLRNFEKGGKPIDPKLAQHLELNELVKKLLDGDSAEGSSVKKPAAHQSEPPKCTAVVTSLHKLLQLSYGNLQPTGKRIMITIDLSDKMNNPCLRTKNITCLEAAVILTLSILNVERDVVVAVFHDNKVFPVSLEKNMAVNRAIMKIKQAKSGYVMATAAFEFAASKKKQIDVFINLMYYHHWFLLIPKELRDKEKPIEALNKYRKRMHLTQTKLITFSLYSPHLSLANGSENVLDVCGFDKDVPKVVEAFCRGSFC